MDEEVEEEQQAARAPPLALSTLHLVRSAQGQHGVKHSEFKRYRRVWGAAGCGMAHAGVTQRRAWGNPVVSAGTTARTGCKRCTSP